MQNDVIRGAVGMAFAVAGGLLLRHGRIGADQLLGLFALALITLAANRVLLVAFEGQPEHTILFYAVRLAAFILILAAIVDKNTRPAT